MIFDNKRRTNELTRSADIVDSRDLLIGEEKRPKS
jgi:hypothetical protein